MARTTLAAVSGGLLGVLLAVLALWGGPQLVVWIKGPPALAIEGWAYPLCVVLGGGLGSLTGAVVGAAGALTRGSPTQRSPGQNG